MSAIINSSQRPPAMICGSSLQSKAWRIAGRTGKVAVRIYGGRGFVLSAFLCFLFLCQNLLGPSAAFGTGFEVTPFAQVTINAEGQPLRFPTYLFYDRIADETYVVDGARSWVVVYANDFFPLVTFASGRGIVRPQDGFVDSTKGLIYICQGPDEDKPGRITVYNGAFMVVREIILDDIPKVSDFFPIRVAVNRDGLMYVVGQNFRGVAVFDNDGFFLRLLRPRDETLLSAEQLAAIEGETMESEASGGKDEPAESSESSEDQQVVKVPDVDIPEQFRPKTKEEKAAEASSHVGPVVIRSVSIDEEGRLYLLSDETSKTYVYSPEETFLFSFGAKGGTPRTLSNPRGLAIDEDRHIIYVVDYMRHAILAYNQNNGEYLFEFGGKGKGPGWFNFPTDIAVNNRGQVIITDLFNHRVQVLNVKYQPDFPLSKPSSPVVSSSSGGADRVEQTGGGGEAGPSAEKAPLLETHGVIDEEAIQEDKPIETPTTDTVRPQNDGDEEKGQ